MHNHDNCSCSHNHNDEHHEHNEQFIYITTEDDQNLKCSVLDIFEVKNKEYIALLPVGSDEVFLYQYIEHDNSKDSNKPDFELKNIETDEEFEEVEDAFFDIFNQELFEDINEQELGNLNDLNE